MTLSNEQHDGSYRGGGNLLAPVDLGFQNVCGIPICTTVGFPKESLRLYLTLINESAVRT